MARKQFERQGIRTPSGGLATGVEFVVYSDEPATALADISATSGGSSIAGSTVTVAAIAGLGPASFRFWGPTDGTAVLYLRCPSAPSLGVQEVEAEPEAGGGGVTDHGALTGLADDDHPQYETSAEAATKVTTHEAAADPHTGYVLESLYDAKGDLLPASAADTPAKLTVGANDTVLTADSSTGTGLKWATPAAGGIPATLLDAKGDLIGASANDTAARLAVGADGAKLVADAAQTTGLRWVTSGAFPQTMNNGFVTGPATIGINACYYVLVTDGGVQTISNLTIIIGTSSGNISVAVYSSTGSGRTRAPNSRLATSGAVASPGTGERTIALGGSVTVVPYETWFAISADNNTVTIQRAGSSASETLKGLVASQATAHPAPTSAASLTSGAFVCYWIAGS